jgi:arylsulfatase A-like enzyme
MLGCYGNQQIRTPNIDRIAEEGIRFTQAIVQAPFTPASHASILTGLNPYLHGIRRMVGHRLSDRALLLPEILKANGYRTAGFIGAGALGSPYGFNRGFETFDEDLRNGQNIDRRGVWGNMRSADEVTRRGLDWLRKHHNDKFFLFMHYFDAHERHGTPFTKESTARRIEQLDENIGRVAEFLSTHDLMESTCWVLTSDHGDSFGEHHEWGHRTSLFDTTLRVPLILRIPGLFKSSVVASQVRSIDITPTLLDMAKITHEEPNTFSIQGISLLDHCTGKTAQNLPAYSETAIEHSVDDFSNLKTKLFSLRTGEWKLIYDAIVQDTLLYDLHNDPDELNDLHEHHPEIMGTLKQELFNHGGFSASGNDFSRMSDQEEAKLKSALKGLGYVD